MIAVSDLAGATASLPPFDIAVENVNDIPMIGGTPALTVKQDEQYRFVPTAEDIDAGDTLTFSVANKPAWATFDEASGELVGTPGNDDVGHAAGIVVAVTDVAGASASLPAFDIIVQNVVMAGDINDDETVDLIDLILALQISSGRNLSAVIHQESDINNNGSIGMEEAIYILQKSAEIR